MCFPAIMAGEESCKGCPGYSTCPNSTAWEEDWTEADEYCEQRERDHDEYYDNDPW